MGWRRCGWADGQSLGAFGARYSDVRLRMAPMPPLDVNPRDGADSFSAASSESLGPAQSFFQRRILFCAHVSVYGLRLSLLLRIGWDCLIIAVLEDDHLHPLMAEPLC